MLALLLGQKKDGTGASVAVSWHEPAVHVPDLVTLGRVLSSLSAAG